MTARTASPGVAVIAAVLGAAACSHTHATERAAGDDDTSARESKAGDTTPRADRGAAPRARDARSESGGVPVATSAGGLLAPGASDQIRHKLVDGGFLADGDAAIGPGLRRFQQRHDMPATGMPDRATVTKLGLDPDKIFRRDDTR